MNKLIIIFVIGFLLTCGLVINIEAWSGSTVFGENKIEEVSPFQIYLMP